MSTGPESFPPVLIVSMLFLGIGGAMVFGTGVAILMSVFPASERGRVLGLTIGAVYVGLSVGPFVEASSPSIWGGGAYSSSMPRWD